MTTTTWAWLVLLFPLLGATVNGLGYKRLGRGGAGAIGGASARLSGSG